MENWNLIKFNPDYLISNLGNVEHFSLGKVDLVRGYVIRRMFEKEK